MAWNTQKFIERFIKGTLGRKTRCGNYHLIENKHCSIMVKTVRGTYEVVALKFPEKDTPVFVYPDRFYGQGRNPYNSIPLSVKENVIDYRFGGSDFTECGVVSRAGKSLIVDIDGEHHLVDINIEQLVKTSGAVKQKDFLPLIKSLADVSYYNQYKLYKLDSNTSDVEEAKKVYINEEALNTKGSIFLGGAWFIPIDDSMELPSLTDNEIEEGLIPPHPWHYGIPHRFWYSKYDRTGIKSDTIGRKADEFRKAEERYTVAHNRYLYIYTKNISTYFDSFHQTGPFDDGDYIGETRCDLENKIVYIKGEVKIKQKEYSYKELAKGVFKSWHKYVPVDIKKGILK
jgi:hypothetical protein